MSKNYKTLFKRGLREDMAIYSIVRDSEFSLINKKQTPSVLEMGILHIIFLKALKK
jgi:hypothetical protein